MSKPPHICLITPPAFEPEAFAPLLAAALDTVEVACVRLRLAGAGEAALTRAAGHLLAVCHAREAALVIEDHFRLVVPLGLDGVHLAQPRAHVREVRNALGRERIVGAFGGATRHDAIAAAEAGADYVSLGPVAAGSLGDGAEAGEALFEWWAEMIEVPSMAEGGLTPANAGALAGLADFVAPCRSVWEAGDGPEAALRAYRDALEWSCP